VTRILMSANTNPEAAPCSQALQRLADALSDDILNTPAEKLIAEVAEDHGDGRAFAKAFERILTRAVRQSLWGRVMDWIMESLARTSGVVAWRPVMVSIGAVLVVVIASGLLIRQQREELQTIAIAPVGDRTATRAAPERHGSGERLAVGKAQSEPSKGQEASEPATLSRSANAARTETSASDDSKSVRTVTVRPEQPEGNARVAGTPPSTPRAALSPQAVVASNTAAISQPAGSAERASEISDDVPASGLSAVPSFSWPVRGRIITGFGPNGGRLRNDGINIAVPEGTDIRAADNGVVMYAGSDLRGYGNLVLVRHGNGFVTAYAHASTLLVSRGDTVQRGQVIAKSGRSGGVTEPLVHFEIRKDTVPVDPSQYLPPD
jgi:murein DD-endopeptidase MepM/ murein hydrolase activator NlpD